MRTRFYKKIIPLLLAAALIYTTGITALAAHAVPDLDETGSVTVMMQAPDTKEAVSGGVMTLYQAGDVQVDGADFSFVLTDAFLGSDLALEDVESAELAEGLAEYAKTNRLAGEEISIGADGTAVFLDLKPGLYLLVQTQAANGYYAVAPFLVTVPMMDGEGYVYDVDATPKMGQLVQIPGTETPGTEIPGTDTPETETPGTETPGTEIPGTGAPGDKTSQTGTPGSQTSGTSASSGNTKLPQTGQLNWPVPVLAISGLLLFAIGWMLYFAEKRKNVYAH